MPNPASLLALWLLLGTALVTAAPARAAVRVEIEGIDAPLLDNVRALLGIEQNKDLAELSELRVRLLHERAPQEIRTALQPFGYYRPAIEGALEATAGGWVARYRINPGPLMRLGSVEIELLGDATDDPAFTALVDRLPLKPGNPAEHTRYEEAKTELQRLASERGYFDARFVARELQIDLDAYRADVRLRFDAGTRYRFGEVRFRGGELREELLRRYLPFRAGEPYLSARLLELQGDLLDSDYYADVRVVPLTEEAEAFLVPLEVTLTPRPPQRYTLGVGFGTDTGARGTLGWDWRRVNDRGHRLSTSLAVAEIRTSISASYTIPVRDPRSDRLTFSVLASEEETDTSFSRVTGVGGALEQALGRWRQTWTLDLQQEESEIAGVRERVNLIIPGMTWQRVWGAERLRPRNGHRILVDVHGGSETLGSDISFLQARVQGKHIVGVGGKTRLLGRWDLGGTLVDETLDLPASQRFFAGGDQSVRGYAFESLGPTDSAGRVVGGRHLAVASLEIERRLRGRWSGALFYDAGYAFDKASEPLSRGIGLGLRWQSPVGPIRLDIARALDKPGEPLRLHLVIGPDL